MSTALIQEAWCIGCTKCIQVCPVDAIIGSAKWMHTVLSQVCTGCGACIEPCPMDCIELLPNTDPLFDPLEAEKRTHQREQRLHIEQTQQKTPIERPVIPSESRQTKPLSIKEEIAAAVARAKAKKRSF